MDAHPGLSEAEREVLKTLWETGPATVREIKDSLAKQGRGWAYTTVSTLLQRLANKQYAAADSSAVPHIYRATVSREELLERRLKDTAQELCDGRVAPLLLALVQGNRFSVEEIARFRRLLDEAADEGKTGRPKS